MFGPEPIKGVVLGKDENPVKLHLLLPEKEGTYLTYVWKDKKLSFKSDEDKTINYDRIDKVLCTYEYMYVRMWGCMHEFLLRTSVCVCVCARARVCVCLCMCVCLYMCMYIYFI